MATFDRTLILETSGRVGRAALASGETIIAERGLSGERRRSSDLAAVVAAIFDESGWRPNELTSVVVGLGPGSYTGLRVGLTTAKALCHATGCEFIGVETFAAIAFGMPAGRIAVIGDALQGKLYHRGYVREGELTPTSNLTIVDRVSVMTLLDAATTITGPGDGLVNTDRSREAPEPASIDLLRTAMNCDWACERDVWRAEPLYLRGSSAEENAKPV